MIFVPEKEKCITWNETKEGIYILYFVDGNETRELPISFFWAKGYRKKKYDPFYIEVRECMRNTVLRCGLPCDNYPQLRFNKILNKWFCSCPSSMICTKNTDEDELELPSIKRDYINSKINEENGYFDNPIQAILYWNVSIAKGIVEYDSNLIEKIKNGTLDINDLY